MASFDQLARVEMQIVMQHCDKVTLLQLARCSRSTFAAASHSFAWRSLSPLSLQCESPLELSARVSPSLLRFAHLDVEWGMRPQSKAGNSDGGEAGGETAEQPIARAETEAAAVAALPGLRRLQVWGHSADAARLFTALLARLDHGGALASLQIHLSEEQLRHAECQSLAALVGRSRTLTALQMEGTFDSDAIRCLADGVRQSQSLTTLSLNCDIGAEDAAALAQGAAHCRTLTGLQLSECGISDAGVEALVAALEQGGNNLRSLDLIGTNVEAAGAASVARLLASDRCVLQSLDLSHCDIGNVGAQSLAEALRTNRTLTELRLRQCCIRPYGTAALAAALQTNCQIPLRSLDLSINKADATGAASLAGFLRTNQTLEVLILCNFSLEDATVAALAAGLPAAHSLRELRVSGGRLSLEGATALAAGVGACPSLTRLDVSGHPALGNGGLAALVPALGHIRTLDISSCCLTDAALLVELLQPQSKLHILDLGFNSLDTAGMVAFAASLQPSSALRTLRLGTCGVDAEGAAALGQALRRGWSVTDLNLGSNRSIGADGVRALASALDQCGNRCSLLTLSLNDCGLSAAASLPLVRAATAVLSLRSLLLFGHPALPDADKATLLAARGGESHLQLRL